VITDDQRRDWAIIGGGSAGTPPLTPSGGDDAPAISARLYEFGFAELGPGIFTIGSSIVMLDGWGLQGSGENVTIIQALNGATITPGMVSTQNFATLTGSQITAGCPNLWTISNLTLDGNKNNAASNRGIASFAWSVQCHDVLIRNCTSDGQWWECPTSDESTDGRSHQIDRVRVHDNDGSGIVMLCGDSMLSHFLVFNNGHSYGDATTFGVWTRYGVAMLNSGHVWGSGHQYNMRLDAETKCVNVEVEGAPPTGAQIAFFANGSHFVNGYLYGGGVSGAVAFAFGDPVLAPYLTGIRVDTMIEEMTGGVCTNFDYGPSQSVVRLAIYNSGRQPALPGGIQPPNGTTWEMVDSTTGDASVYQSPYQLEPRSVWRASVSESSPAGMPAAANDYCAVQVVIGNSQPITGVQVVVTTIGTGADVIVGLCDSAGVRVASSNSTALAAGTTRVPFTASYSPLPGIYYLEIVFSADPLTVAGSFTLAPATRGTLSGYALPASPIPVPGAVATGAALATY
jgi:hypothetical protein